MDKCFDPDVKAEELLTALGKELCKSRVRYVNSLLTHSGIALPFYAEPVSGCEKELSRNETVYKATFRKNSDAAADCMDYADQMKTKAGGRRVLKRGLILVAILVLILGTMAVSVDAVRLKLFNFIFEDHPGHTVLVPQEDENQERESSEGNHLEEGEMPDFDMGYIPDGYELVNRGKDETMFWMDYGNAEERYIHLTVHVSDSGSVTMDNDTLQREEVRIGEYQGWYFYDQDKRFVTWQMGNYFLIFDDGNNGFSKEEILKIAASVKLKQ